MTQQLTQPTGAQHPGKFIRRELKARKLSIAQGAELAGFSKAGFENVIYGRTGVSARLAIRLSEMFEGTTPLGWMEQQSRFELDRERQTSSEAAPAAE